MAQQAKALAVQAWPQEFRTPEPIEISGCDPSMCKVETGDPWNKMARLAESARSGFKWETLPQYIRQRVIGGGSWL